MITARQRKPLMEAIEHWKEIERGEGIDLGADSCSLCMKFTDEDCTGCPVRERTGLRECRGTPYSNWSNAQYMLGRRSWDIEQSQVADTTELQSLARAEREFLESLLKG